MRCLSTSCFFIGVGESPRGRKSNRPESKQQQHSSNQRSRKNCFLSLRVDLCPFLSVGTVCPLVSPLLLRMTCFQSLPFCERSLSFFKFFFFYFLLLAFAVLYIQGSRLDGRDMRCLKFSENPHPRCAGGSLQRALSCPEVPDPVVIVAVVVASSEERLRALLCVSPPAASAPVGRPARGLLFGF